MSHFTQDILSRVAQYIAQQRLFVAPSCAQAEPEPEAHVYVGLSGGPDSVALLHILQRLGYDCVALHCNFHLRGEESMRDQRFCEQICQMLGIPLRVKEFDTRSYMRQHHLSLEMAARELRYAWWRELLSSQPEASQPHPIQPTAIALGHHQDDSIETLLMNLMRGTGAHGLTGIVPRNDATRVIRPLLCLSRQEILDYLLDNDLSYVLDSTNADCDTLRNQIRNQLLPLMEQLVPQARNGILTTMQHVRETSAFAAKFLNQYDGLTEHLCRWGIEWDELQLHQLPPHFTPAEVEGYLFEWRQKYCDAATQRVVRTARLIFTQPLDDSLIEQHSPTLDVEACDVSSPEALTVTSAADLCQCFDADTLTLPLALRRWHEGDRLAPIGMHGHTKLVSDLFTNAHYSPMQKATTWLVTDATESIIWVAGLRISELHKVKATTSRVVAITLR